MLLQVQKSKSLTANAFSEDRLRAVEAGMNEHLAKPLESTVIIKTIAKYLKEEWIRRCSLRGSSPEFCQKIADYWDEWIDDIEDDVYLPVIRLDKTCQNIVELLTKIDLLHLKEKI